MSSKESCKFLSEKISIITVCRNSADSIYKTIESIISQSYNNLEYIIIDGDSTDGTQGIVKFFGNAIDIFVSEPDKGIADAFNKGIAMATGDIIGLINSDDVLLPGSLSRVATFFRENQHCDVVHGDVVLYDGNFFIKRLRPPKHWWYPWRLVFFNHPATFVRKSVYDKYGGYCLEYKVAMDVEIFLRWLRRGVEIDYIPECLVRMQAGGVSSQNGIIACKEAKKALIAHNFSRFLANIQYVCKIGLHYLAILQTQFRLISIIHNV